MRLGFFAFLVTLILDQVTKIWVVSGLDLKTAQAIDVLPPFLNFRMAWNRGVNFGLFSGDSDANRWILILIALGVTGVVLFWVRRESDARVFVAAGILAGGAIGNVIDRIRFGAVADFINMSCCGIHNPFSFNVADVAIFLGALGLVFWVRGEKAA